MGRMLEMFRRVTVRRAVTTTDMPTAKAETQMNPGGSDFQAFFTALSVSSHRLNSESRVGHESPLWLKGEAKIRC